MYKLTKRSEHSLITSISLSTLQDGYFIIHMTDYDTVCMDERKTEIVTKIIEYAILIFCRLNYFNVIESVKDSKDFDV